MSSSPPPTGKDIFVREFFVAFAHVKKGLADMEKSLDEVAALGEARVLLYHDTFADVREKNQKILCVLRNVRNVQAYIL